MNTITKTESPLLWRFLSYSGCPENITDICGFRMRVLLSVFSILTAVAIGVFFTLLVVMGPLAVIFGDITTEGTWLQGIAIVSVAIYFLVFIGLVCFVGYKVLNYVMPHLGRAVKTKDLSLIKESYLSWKHKYCTRVNFIDDEN